MTLEVLTYEGLIIYDKKIKALIDNKDGIVKAELTEDIDEVNTVVVHNTEELTNHETRIHNLEVTGGDEPIPIPVIDDICQ